MAKKRASRGGAPRFIDAPPAIEIVEGATVRVNPRLWFEGAAGFNFDLLRRRLDTGIATARKIGAKLTVNAVSVGSTELVVRVRERGNPANFAQGRIPVMVARRASFAAPAQPVRMFAGAAPKPLELEDFFNDASGYTYSYAGSDNEETATGAVAGSTLTVTGLEPGLAHLRVRATYPHDDTIFAQGLVPVIVESRPVVNPKPLPGTGDGPAPGARNIVTQLALSIGKGPRSIDAGTLKVYRVQGREEISRPFRYVIDLLRVDPENRHLELKSGDVLDSPATLEISVSDGGPAPMKRKIHGIIGEFVANEVPAPTAGSGVGTVRRYRLVLVPRLAMMARNRQNRIHATAAPLSLDELIRCKLTSTGTDYHAGERPDRFKLERSQFRIAIDKDSLPLDPLSHVAQCNETDLDFICRLCEHHGVHFFFSSDATDSHDMVVFGNTSKTFGYVRFAGDDAQVGYTEKDYLQIRLAISEAAGGSRFHNGSTHAVLHGVLHSFRSVERPLPKSIRLIGADDSGARGPDLARTGAVDPRGKGIHADYDTCFSTQASGEAFAAIRAEEIRAANSYHIGVTNSPCIAPGLIVERTEDSHESNGRKSVLKYLITRIEIDVKQAHSDVIASVDGEVIQTGFLNTFNCVDFRDRENVFRPARRTPIPRVPGVHTAYIASGDKARPDRPNLEEDGTYRIHSRHLDERDGLPVAQKSKPVLKAEPYAGRNVGMHFPLKQDTEVLIAYRNGDPDRPIIAGAMPGQVDFLSPVTANNETSHVIRTSTGASFEMHDDYVKGDAEDHSGIVLRSGASTGREASYVRIGKSPADDLANGSESDHRLFDLGSDTVADAYRGVFTYTPKGIYEVARGVKITNVNERIETRSLQEHLLLGRRMAIVAGSRDRVADEPTTDDDNILLHADGDLKISAENVVENVRGNVAEVVEGSTTTETGGSDVKIVREDSRTHVFANASKMIVGASNNMVVGTKSSMNVGLVAGFAVTGSLKIEGPFKVSVGYGVGIGVKPTLNFNYYQIKAEVVTMKVEKVNAKMGFGDIELKQNLAKLGNIAMDFTQSAASALMAGMRIII